MKNLSTGHSKKPPLPLDSHECIDVWLEDTMPSLKPIIEYLDAQICNSLQDLKYAVKWKKAYYGTPNQGWIMELVAYDVSVNMVFLGAANFVNPPELGDGARYVKVRSLDEAQSQQLKDWILEAGTVAGWK